MGELRLGNRPITASENKKITPCLLNSILSETGELMIDDNAPPAPYSRGKLRIFLGYAAGVGKTYAMLQSARRRLVEGVDVVAANLDQGNRPEISSLLSRLEMIPLATLSLDAVLTRHPQLALIDNMVYRNPPGSRHAQRYEDVLELLEAGINVYTTLNIQDLAGLNDIVNRITGCVIQETIPDHIFDEADAVELIDLPPDELLQRLHSGQFNIPELLDDKFFRSGNLMALRELALRRSADRIDSQLRAYMQDHDIRGPWPVDERLLVCVSPSPLSARLVQTTRRLAAGLNTEWFAVYVEIPEHTRLSAADHDRVAHNLQLAESLGARTMTLTGNSVAEAVTSFARMRNVTKIVVGKSQRPRWAELRHGSIIDQIVYYSGDLDIYVINSTATQPVTDIQWPVFKPRYQWRQYAQSVGLVVIATLIGYPLRSFIEPTNLVMLYLLAVVIAALRLGRYPAIVASILSVIAFNFVFVPPYYTYAVTDAQFLLTFAALLTVGIVISTLAAQARDQTLAAQRREAQTNALYEFNRDLTTASDVKGIAGILLKHVMQTFHLQAAVLLPTGNVLSTFAAGDNFDLNFNEMATATWVFEHQRLAGRGTTTFSESKGIYLPLQTAQKVRGVLGIQFTKTGSRLAADQQRSLESFTNQAAQSIERVQLAEEARQTQLLRETEKLQTALLNSISHDLRTPLASITGALSSLCDDAAFLDETAQNVLISTAWEQADRLNNLVGNLLQMTRMEAGGMKVKPELCDVQDMIGVALAQLGNRLDERPINIEIPDDRPLVPMDMVLMVQVLVNLLDNALKYSPLQEPVTIHADLTESEMVLQIIDEGLGIPEPELEHIFGKFYRLERPDDTGGTGLGLSISKGIVEAHHGRIWATNRDGGGAIFSLAIPLSQQKGVKERL